MDTEHLLLGLLVWMGAGSSAVFQASRLSKKRVRSRVLRALRGAHPARTGGWRGLVSWLQSFMGRRIH